MSPTAAPRRLSRGRRRLIERFLEKCFHNPQALVRARWPALYAVAVKRNGEEDVRQACMLGLVRAAWKFKRVVGRSGKPVRFFSYAVFWLRAMVADTAQRGLTDRRRLGGSRVTSLGGWEDEGEAGGRCDDGPGLFDSRDERRMLRERLREVEGRPLYRLIFRLRYGLDEEYVGEKLTLDVLAGWFGMTRERVRQVCVIVLAKLTAACKEEQV